MLLDTIQCILLPLLPKVYNTAIFHKLLNKISLIQTRLPSSTATWSSCNAHTPIVSQWAVVSKAVAHTNMLLLHFCIWSQASAVWQCRAFFKSMSGYVSRATTIGDCSQRLLQSTEMSHSRTPSYKLYRWGPSDEPVIWCGAFVWVDFSGSKWRPKQSRWLDLMMSTSSFPSVP